MQIGAIRGPNKNANTTRVTEDHPLIKIKYDSGNYYEGQSRGGTPKGYVVFTFKNNEKA